MGKSENGDKAEKPQLNGGDRNKSVPKLQRPRSSFRTRSNPKDVTDVQRAFLDAFMLLGTITGAAREVSVSRMAHHRDWMGLKRDGSPKDTRYQSAFAEAENAATENLVSEARRRAMAGSVEDVRYHGEVVGQVRKYSDNLLMFLIKAKLPEYRDRYEVTTEGGPLLQVELSTIRQIHSEVAAEQEQERDSTSRAALKALKAE